jgi:vacuolar-type H+-ATPase subunit H
MPRQDTVDFVTAFAIGAVLGVGATLLLRGDVETQTERLLREMRPLRKHARKRIQRARKGLTRRMHDAETAGEDLVGSGRAALGDFRDQVADIISTARKEIDEAARDGVREAQRAVKRGAWR